MSDFFQVNDHAVEIPNAFSTEQPLHVDSLIAEYVKLRDDVKKIEALAAKKKEERDQIGTLILDFLDSTGQESAKTTAGTAFIKEQAYASCSDPDSFMGFVADNNALELVDRKPNSIACQAFATQHGHLPPGVKLTIQRRVNVRAGEKT